MMDFKRWLAEERLRSHKTNKEEILGLLEIVQRDLNDAAVSDLSADRRFLITYEGALTLATIPLYCAGYETYGKGHHWLTFRLLPEVMGGKYFDLAQYLISAARSEILELMIGVAKSRNQRWTSCYLKFKHFRKMS